MPWNGTLLYLAESAENGALGEPQLIAGGPTESIFQPEWSPDGTRIAYRGIGCQRGIGLPIKVPYSVVLDITHVLGKRGIEVIGANRKEQIKVP